MLVPRDIKLRSVSPACCRVFNLQRRGSSRHLTLQPQVPIIKTTLDFASGVSEAKKHEARRAADHGPKEAIMAPF